MEFRKAYMLLVSLWSCFSLRTNHHLQNFQWLISPINLIILPIQANQGYPPSNLQHSIFPGMVASVLLVQIIGNSIPFVHMSATAANSHANQDPCVHF